MVKRVSELTGVESPIIVGSQTLYAVTESVPSIVRDSVECDFMLAEAGIEAIQAVNHHLGVLSSFSQTNGYFADGLGLATVVLAPGLISMETLVERAALILETAHENALLPRLQKLFDYLHKQRAIAELKSLSALIIRLR